MSDRICAGPAKTTSWLLRGAWGRCFRRAGGPWIDLALRSFRRVRSIKHEPAPWVHRWRVRELQLTAQPQLVDDVLVARAVLLLEVVEQATTLPDHDQQAATRVEILLVRLQMLGQILDPFGQESHLHLRCAGVLAAIAVFLDQFLLAISRDRHRVSPCSLEVQYPHRNQLAGLESGQGHEPALRHGADHAAGSKLVNTVAVLSVEQSNRLSRPKADRLGGRQSQGRDVVQRGFDGHKVLKSGGTMPQGLQRFQRNRPPLRERPDGGSPQVPDMAASP